MEKDRLLVVAIAWYNGRAQPAVYRLLGVCFYGEILFHKLSLLWKKILKIQVLM